MAIRAEAPSQTSRPTSKLEEARNKFRVIEHMYSLKRDSFLTDEDVERIPSQIPVTDEEFTAFMQQLFQYGIRKHLPGCPVRVNSNVLSVRLDGVQFRKAQEIRQLFEKNGIRSYISEKNRTLHQTVERNQNQPLRGNGYTEFIQEEGRDFYHIPCTSRGVNHSGMQGIYQSIFQQGKADAELASLYDTFMGLVTERNEERRREFIRNRTTLNAEYIAHVVEKLTIPVEALRNEELAAALREAGLTAFIKKPTLRELISTDIMVDVFSAPSEEDETWKIMPVTPTIVESNDELLYHGLGQITAYDPDSQASKNGLLPFVIQHCLRAGANINDFLAVLPEDFVANLNACNEIYERIVGESSEGLDKNIVVSAYRTWAREEAERQAREAILSAPVSESASLARTPIPFDERHDMPDIDVDVELPRANTRDELDRMVREAFGQSIPEEQAVQQAQSAVAQSLTESLLAQLQQQGMSQTIHHEPVPHFGEEPDDEDDQDGDDDLPFDGEPAVVDPVGEAIHESLAESLMRQLREQEAQRQQAQAQPARAYHESYGENPIFKMPIADARYLAFRGQEGREFTSFNQAAIYAGKRPGQIVVYEYNNKNRELTMEDNVHVHNFNGSLI